jgi:hypothetical protein
LHAPPGRLCFGGLLNIVGHVCEGPFKVTVMCLVRDRQETSRPEAQRRDIPLRVLNGPGGPLVHPSLLDYAPGKEGLHEFMRIRPIAIFG